MAVIVEFAIASEAFPFGRAVGGDPDVTVSLEQVIPLKEGRIPFVWASGSDFDDVESTLRKSDIVKRVEVMTRVEDSVLYYVEWYESKEAFMNGLVEANGAILDAHGDSTWAFTAQFKNHADLTRFHQFYQAHDFPVHIDRVYSLSEEPGDTYGFGLTPPQREALVGAVEGGYFAVPRETTLDEIAEKLNISRQAASERVRRGAEKILRKALLGLSAKDFELASPDDE
ncbi:MULTISPECIES: helix-turn-helix domain-containing protein [Halorussus]|uniref:helix-turn-helix domain-containing protein n=1 Tax=Halorussus TaxID=1070314 RepID=UPI00209E6419|nr:helix-turn-helix domain-containing protein [Halorussus vallis]USZ75257.1 helix-turn-helix domain-containing protein [Halorussus vallis]